MFVGINSISVNSIYFFFSLWSLKNLIKNSLGITKHPSSEQKNRLDIERQASKSRLFQETESEPLSRATPPNYFSNTFSFFKSTFQGILLGSPFSLETLSTLKATVSLSLAFFPFHVCLWISLEVTHCLGRGWERLGPTPRTIST